MTDTHLSRFTWIPGGQMAVTIQRQCASAVTELYEDAFGGSSMENGTTMITFDLRQHDFHQDLGTQARLWGRKEASHVAGPELSPFHHPIIYRFIVAQGAYLDTENQRRYFTPESKGVSTAQPRSHRGIRLACYLAVVCGGRLRPMALLFSVLFLIPMTKSSSQRWIDAIGAPLPTPEELLQPWLALTPATAWPLDGDYPLGTDPCVMVVKDEPGRSLMPHEAAAEHGEDARKFKRPFPLAACIHPVPGSLATLRPAPPRAPLPSRARVPAGPPYRPPADRGDCGE
jgi:hypothetical protein